MQRRTSRVWQFISWCCRLCLSLRYKIRVEGLEALLREPFSRPGGVLFLPNHTAHMDPLFLFLLLWPHFRIRPLVIEYIYRQKGLHAILKWIGAQPIPNFDTSVNQLKIKKGERAMEKITAYLQQGQNILLYPSGHLKSVAKETLGGASGAHALLQSCPEINVVLVRTTGLWGSSFSRALLGHSPDLKTHLLKGLKSLFKNALFFAPRRRILIEFAVASEDFPRAGTRLEVNRYLEKWYNSYEDGTGKRVENEPLQLVPALFWKRELPTVFQSKKRRRDEGWTHFAASSDTRSKIYQEIRRILDRPEEEIRPEMHLSMDLGMDSLNIAELVTFLSLHYEVTDLHPENLDTVASVLELAEGARGTERPMYQEHKSSWPIEKTRLPPTLPVGRTLVEAFFRSADRMGGLSACADDLIGVVSYRKLKRMVLVLAEAFRKMPGSYVAVLLPASVGTYAVILALLAARKIPVMLNWTLGPRYLDEMMRMTGAESVISSWRFLERLSSVEFGSLIDVDKVFLLEDIKESLSLTTKGKGLMLSFLAATPLSVCLGLGQVHEEDPAVILFTSGTETSPKGVPLSHRNLLANQRSAMQCIHLTQWDALYGILPPFHSFGFSVAGLLPLFTGIRVAFYPDPTDSCALAEGIARWQVTLFCTAPSFLRGLLETATPEQLSSVRLFVSGAEKLPAALREKVAQLGTQAKLIEGYGITECSPILSLHRFNLPPQGVGHPLPDVELCTIHPETHELLPEGTEGEICVRGPNVFKGYLGTVPSPFIEIQGLSWYRTGDLGYLDADGQLILSGRLKRFVKLGGEMISLGAIEEALALHFRSRASADGAPAFALCAEEQRQDKPQLVLFTTVAVTRDEANQALRQAGFSRLVKISAVQQITELPLLGTGKTDYRKLQAELYI